MDLWVIYTSHEASTSTADRMLRYLKQRGELTEPKRRNISAKRKSRRPCGVRKLGDYMAKRPEDLVQVDTLDGRPFPWMVLKQFTARDVIEARDRATATTAKEFIETLEQRMPFKVKALQVDGGRSSIRTLKRSVRGGRFGYLFCLRRVQRSMAVWKGRIGLIPKSFMKCMIVPGI